MSRRLTSLEPWRGLSGSALPTLTDPFVQLQVLLPGETNAPGTETGKTGTPTAQVPHVPFFVRVIAVGEDFTPVFSADLISLTRSDGLPGPGHQSLASGLVTFAVTVAANSTLTFTAIDLTDQSKTLGVSASVEIISGDKLFLIPVGSMALTPMASQIAGDRTVRVPVGTFGITTQTATAALSANQRVTLPVGSFTATSLPATIPGGAKAVLTRNDFEYVGVIRPPYGTAFSSGAMTGKTVSGQVHLYVSGDASTTYGAGAIMEFLPLTPAASFDLAGVPTALTTFPGSKGGGTFYGTAMSAWYPSTAPFAADFGYVTNLLYYNGFIYWSYNALYNTGGVNMHCLGMTDVSGGSPGTPYGPWQFACTSHYVGGSNCLIPSAFGDAYCGGARMGLSLGLSSGNAGSSWGPNLEALVPPTTSTPSGLGSAALSTTTLLRYGNTSDPSSRRYRRDGNYNVFVGGGSPDVAADGPGAHQGYWTQYDNDQGGPQLAVTSYWIDLSDKHGFLCAGFLGHEDVWYQTGLEDQTGCDPVAPSGSHPAGSSFHPGPTGQCAACHDNVQGPTAHIKDPHWWIFDPADLALIAQGAAPYSKTTVDDFDPNVIHAFNYTACQPSVASTGGMYLDSANRLLYVSMPGVGGAYTYDSAIQVYHIK